MRSKRSLLVLLPLLLLLAPLSGQVAVAAEPQGTGSVEYNRIAPTVPLVNAVGVKDFAFLNKFIGADNNSVFNLAPEFKRTHDRGSAEAPERLVFGTTFRHEDDDNTYDVTYTYKLPTELEAPAEKGDLQIALLANLTNDHHWNVERHWDKLTAYPVVSVSTWSRDILKYDTSDYKGDTTQTVGRYKFAPLGCLDHLNLWFEAWGAVCTCGSSKVSNINIILADTAGPRVTSVVASKEPDGQGGPYFQPGDTMYITMTFDESIRFADDRAMPLANAPKLKLELRGIADNVVKNVAAEASLLSLNGNKLTFSYQVPATYILPEGSVNTNFYVASIAPYTEQTTWVSSNETFELKLFGKNGAAGNYLNHSSKTTSLIVDTAGNPIDISKSTRNLQAAAYLDGIAPEIMSIEIAGKTDAGDGGLASNLYARLGERLGFFVQFSEPVQYLRVSNDEPLPFDRGYLDSSGELIPGAQNMIFVGDASDIELLAELNITDGGSPVTARAHYTTTVRLKDGRMVSRVFFVTPQPLKDSISPQNYGTGAEMPIGINRIYMGGGAAGSAGKYYLGDACSNRYNEGTEYINVGEGQRLMPKQQLWLDTGKPTATTSLVAADGKYQPLTYGAVQETTAFCFPLLVSDPLTPTGVQSGSNGVTGYFMWRDEQGLSPIHAEKYPFEYVVTGSSDQPDDSEYQSALTYGKYAFTQIDSGNFLHLRFVDGADYNFSTSQLVIYPVDNANNQGEVVFTLDFTVDRKPPVIEQKRTATYSTGTGSIHTTIQLQDVSEMEAIEYQWTDKGASPDGYWEQITSYSTRQSSRYRYYEFSQSRTNLAPGAMYTYTLHVRATDAAGNRSTASFDYELDLELPTFNLEFATDPSQPNGRHSLLLSPPSDDPNKAIEVWALVRQPEEHQPYGTDTRYYYMKAIDMQSLGTSSKVDLLAVDDNWSPCEVSSELRELNGPKPGKVYAWGWAWSSLDAPTSDSKPRFLEYMNRYAPLEVLIIARPNEAKWGHYDQTFVFDAEPVLKRTYTFNYASDYLIGESDSIHSITITPKSHVYPTTVSWDKLLIDSPSALDVPRSLDGAVFGVSLANVRYPAYGLQDIDFESEHTVFALYKTGAGTSQEPIFSSKLVAKAYQEIAIPAGTVTESGSYTVVVTVQAKGSNHIDRQEYTDILVDCRELTTYGISEVTTSQPLDDLGQALMVSTDYALSDSQQSGTICVSAKPSAQQYIRFDAEIASLTTIAGQPHYAAYLQVWNEAATDLLGEDVTYPWIYLPAWRQYQTVLLTEANREEVRAALTSSNVGEAAILPILPGQNLINYRLALPGGYKTPIQSLVIDAASAEPTISMQLTPQPENGLTTNGGVIATPGLLQSPLVAPEALLLGVLDNAALNQQFAATRQAVITQNGDYCFYAVDKFHNVGYQQLSVDHIDRTAPSLTVKESVLSGSLYTFTVQIEDDFDLDNCQLFIQFDDDYCELLGVQSDAAFAVPTAARWQATAPSASGLYEVTTIDKENGSKEVSFSGAFKYDARVGAPSITERSITLYAVDGAGNNSEEQKTTVSVANQPTTYVKGELASGGFTATFSRPVILSTPQEVTAKPVYSIAKQQLSFYSNGNYPLDCVDLFGYRYTGNVTVNHYDALYVHQVSISETAPTNQDVQIVLNCASNLAITLELPPNLPEGDISPVLDADGQAIGALITMRSNGSFTYAVKPKDSAYPKQPRTIGVQNIDKTAPTVELVWVYSAPIVDGKTAGEVIVSLQADEPLQGLDGTGTTHIFTVNQQDPFIFHYSDLAGNDGYVTATPPVVIVDKDLIDSDITPPDYELEIYRSDNGISSKVVGYTKSAYESLTAEERVNAFPLFSGVLQLRFTPYDENQVSISLQDAPLEGVALSGWTVSVTDNVDFTVVLTDAKGNQTLVLISIKQADNIPPVGTVSYVRTAPYVIRGYLEMSDEGGGPVFLLNTSGVQVDADGKYYHEFLDNESFTFVFADAAGNIGTTVAVVSSLDMTPPSGVVKQWLPYFVDESGIAHPGQLSDRPTNSDVSAFLQFNKPIRALTPWMTSGRLQDFSFSYTEDSATIVFRQNASMEIEFQALNGRSNRLALAVGIIDKQAPQITPVQTAADLKSVTYSFTADEPVFFVDGGNAAQAATSFSKVFELNGDYDLKFTDLAGNSTIKRVTVAGIDRTPPTLTITGLPGSGAALTNETVTFSVSLNEPGTIAFRGVVYQLTAGQVQQLRVDHNGSYELIATDRAGLTTRYMAVVNCIDRTPPQILLPTGQLLIRQGTDRASVERLLLEQVQVYDNADPKPELKLDDYVADEDFTHLGESTVWLVATDKAGNEQWGSAKVRVYGPDELLIRVNGQVAPPNGTLFVSAKASRVVSVAMENVPRGSGGEEPYRIYWKRGICTDAQMKNASLLTGCNFTAQENGFYTIYVVTQSKASLLVHLYVQG